MLASVSARSVTINKVSKGGGAGCAGVSRPAAAGPWATWATMLLLLFCAAAAFGQAEDAGKFEVLEGRHELVDGVYRVDGLIYLRLPSEASEALHATLPLTIRVEAQFLNRLWFWWDSAEFERVDRYRLSYYPLTEIYAVEIERTGSAPAGTDAGTKSRATFPTLAAALEHIGRVDSMPVVAAAELDRNLRYDIRLRAVLDKDELPGPMRLLAFWRKDWSIGSEWLVWRLDDE